MKLKFTDTCNSVRELLSKVEGYLTKNCGSLSREEINELENCISILKKMERNIVILNRKIIFTLD